MIKGLKKRMILYRCHILCTTIALLSSSMTNAAWPEPQRSSYISRCASQMFQQGWTRLGGSAYCECLTEWMEVQDYEKLMKVEPSPNGSSLARQMYGKINECHNYFPPGRDPTDSKLYSEEGKIKPPPLPE